MKKSFVKTVAVGLCIPMLVGCGMNLDSDSETESSVDSSVEITSDEAASEGTSNEVSSEDVADEAATEESTEDVAAESTTSATDNPEANEDEGKVGDDKLVKKCLDGYAQYLKDHTDLWETEAVYDLDYINDDDIPDLIFGDTMANHASNIYILTYLDGNYDEVICCGAFGSYDATQYYPRLGIMRTSDTSMGCDTQYYSELTSEKEYGYKTLCHRYYYYEEDDYEEEPDESKFYLGEGEDNVVTQEEYDEYVNELVGDTQPTLFYTYNNDYGYKYLTKEALDNYFGW